MGTLSQRPLRRPRWPPLSTAGAALAILVSLTLLLAFTPGAHAEASWPTYHQNAERSGLDPEALEGIEPLKDWQSVKLGAPIWGQPLILGARVYVATVGDRIYALQAASGAVIWETDLGTPVPYEELPCGDITPTVGIVSTPVIDTATGVLYAVADTWEASKDEAHHVLVGLDIETGQEVLSTPVDPPGANAKTLLQRSALNIDGQDIVFGFGGNDGSCSEELAPLVSAPMAGGPARFWQDHDSGAAVTAGGVWHTGGASVNGAGQIYVATANPIPPSGEPASSYDYSDSVIELSLKDFVAAPKSEALSQEGFFEPPNWEFLSNNDKDLGSAGPELLAGGLLFQAGKDGTGYLIDEASMKAGSPALYSHQVCAGAGSFGSDSYAAGVIYIPCTNGVQALSYDQTTREFTPLWQGPENAFGPPILAAGLLWDVATGGFSGGGDTLYGLELASGKVRYSETLPSAVADHFASPSAAGGRLLVASGESVTAYQIGRPSTGGEGPSVTRAPSGGGSGSASGAPSAPGASVSSTVSGPLSQTAPALLVYARLHAGPKGRVWLRLRCARAAGSCRGSVSLRVEIRTLRRNGKHMSEVSLPTTLARVLFGPHEGTFSLTFKLGARAQALLHRSHDRLRLSVLIGSPGSPNRSFPAVLFGPA